MTEIMQLLVDKLTSTQDLDDRMALGEKLFKQFSLLDQAAMGFANPLNVDGVEFEAWPNQLRKIAFYASVTGGHALPVAFKTALREKKVVLVGSVDQLDENFPQVFRTEGLLRPVTEVENVFDKDLFFVEAGEQLDKDVRKNIQGVILTPGKLMAMLLTDHGTFSAETFLRMIRAFGAQVVNVAGGATLVYKGQHRTWQIAVSEDSVSLDDREFCPNTFVSGQVDGSAEDKVMPWKAIILTLGYVFQGFSDSDVAGREAYNTEAFIEGPGGAQKDLRSQTVKRHKVGIVSAEAGRNFDLYVRNDSSIDAVNAALRAFLDRNVPAWIQHQGDYVVVGDGARAMGIDFDDEGNLTVAHVADKAVKMANRPALGIAPSAWSEFMEDSKYKMLTSNGPVGTRGIRVKIRVANTSVANLGSGSAAVPVQGYALSVGSARVVRTAVLQSRTKGSPAAQEAEILKELKVYSKVPAGSFLAAQRAVIGGKEVFRPIEGLRWDVDNTVLNVEKFEVKAQHNSNDVKVTIVGSWRAASVGEKLKVDGGKLRTVMAEVFTRNEAFEVQVDYDGITASDETNKGFQLFLVMWAHSDKEFFADKDLVIRPGEELSPEYRERFTWWLTENTRKEWVCSRKSERHFARFQEIYGNDPNWRFDELTGEVSHLTTVLYGEMVTPIEYTTTYENSGKSQAYPELVMAMERVSARLAAHYWVQGNELRNAYYDLFACLNNKQTSQEVVFIDSQTTLFDLSVFDDHNEVVWEVTPDMFHGKSTRAVMKTLATRFPEGCKIVTDSHAVLVDFNALSKVDNYVTGGKSVGPANEIAMLFLGLASDPNSRDQGFMSFVTTRLNKFESELRGLFENAGACRRPLRAGLLFTRKVATSDEAWVNLKSVYFNPNDPLITSGAIKVGQYLGVGRMPMISFGMCQVELHEYVAVGTFLVDPLTWAACNEGDADGDGGFLFDIPETFVEEVRKSLKKGIFGPKGYSTVYEKLPYDDFLKVSPSKASVPVKGNESMWDDNGIFDWHGSKIEPKALAELHANLASHYKKNVGTGYQVATYLLYWVSRNSTQMPNLPQETVAAQNLACVWAWRVLYEKQGLGGYDPKSIQLEELSPPIKVYEVLWEKLDKLAQKYMYATLFSQETGGYVANTIKRDEIVDDFVDFIKLMSSVSDLKPLDRTAATYILRARALGIMGAMLERGNELQNALVGELKLAAEFLLIRRASKGLLASEKNQKKAFDNGHCAVDLVDRLYRKPEDDGALVPRAIVSLKQGLYASMLQGTFKLHSNAVAAVRKEQEDRANRFNS